MIDKYYIDSLATSPIVSTTDSADAVVILDENVYGLATSHGISEIFPNLPIVKVGSVAYSGATDTEIANVLLHKDWNIIFITADKGHDVVIPSEHIAVVRFGNNNTSTDSQLNSLWLLTQTKGFRLLKNWFNKDILIGAQNISCKTYDRHKAYRKSKLYPLAPLICSNLEFR